MAKKFIKKARLKYEAETDTYRLEIWDNEFKEWELDTACKCHASARNPTAEPAFVHYRIITELYRLIQMGYTFEDTL